VISPKIGEAELVNFPNRETSLAGQVVLHQVDFSNCTSVKKIYRLLRCIREIANSESVDEVFYFMTDLFALIAGPYFKLSGVRQVLWYAHAHNSVYLRFAAPFMDIICSSTKGSIPLKGKKIKLVGQMVDSRLFPMMKSRGKSPLKLVHVGRLDPSKNIHMLIAAFENLSRFFPQLTLHFYGAPSNTKSEIYIKNILGENENLLRKQNVKFFPSVPRNELSDLYKDYGIFVHAFTGSLDKTLIEATLSGLPVASINREFAKEFGTWGKDGSSIENEIRTLLVSERSLVDREVERRRVLAEKNHSLESWLVRMKRDVFLQEGH
jgi:glycosyltransferase involved in cell wall biosynthesis